MDNRIRQYFRSLRRPSKRWLAAVAGGGFMALALTTALALAQPPADGEPSPAPLRMATRMVRPDVFEENGEILGFSVDLAQAVANQMQPGPPRPIAIQTYPGTAEVLEAIRTGEADLALGAIALTSQREQTFDFSHPILSAGLQIMVPAAVQQTRRPAQDILNRVLQPDLLKLTGLVALLMLLPAHVLWYFERHNAESMIEHAAYIPGIFEALWWTVLALVGQAEDMPEGRVGKLIAVFWVFVGIIYLTYFTAGLTADLTLQEIQGNIQTLSDLQNRSVALVADESALEYLTTQNLRQITPFTEPEAAYAALKAQAVEAMIAPRPLLLYFAAAEPEAQWQLVGAPFLDQFYAIAMPEGSPYRDPINQAILTLRENGTYTEIHRKWFGVDP